MHPDYDSGRLEVRFVCDGLQILRGKNHGGLDDRGGEFQADAGAEGLLVVQHDFAAGFLDDAVADAEAEASTFAHRLGGEERIERAVQVAESGSGIVEADENAIALARGGNRDGAFALSSTASIALFRIFSSTCFSSSSPMEMRGRSGATCTSMLMPSLRMWNSRSWITSCSAASKSAARAAGLFWRAKRSRPSTMRFMRRASAPSFSTRFAAF